MQRNIIRLLYRLRRGEDGNMVVISAVFVMFLVVSLTVTINLGEAVQSKIKAQNAVDAAALTGAIWQVRGNYFVQEMNNIVFYADTAAFAGLGMAAVCSASTAIPIAGQILNGIGNIALGLSVVCHFTSQFIIIPFRDVGQLLFPVVCYVAASEMAAANGATSVGDIGMYLNCLAAELTERKVAEVDDKIGDMAGINGLGMAALKMLREKVGNSFLTAGEGVLSGLGKLPLYAIGVEEIDRSKKGVDALARLPMTLHVQRRTADGMVSEIIDAGAEAVMGVVNEQMEYAGEKIKEQTLKGIDSISVPEPSLTLENGKTYQTYVTYFAVYSGGKIVGYAKERLGEVAEDAIDDVCDYTVEQMGALVDKLKEKAMDAAAKKLGNYIDMAPPLKIGDAVVKSLLTLCVALPVAYPIANAYFNTMVPTFTRFYEGAVGYVAGSEAAASEGPIWNHPYYESVDDKGEAVETAQYLLPVTTWMVMVRDEAGQKRRSTIWEQLGGLGVPTGLGANTYGELGALALASTQACIQPVRKLRVGGMSGSVQLVPMKLFKGEDEPNMLKYGICH